MNLSDIKRASSELEDLEKYQEWLSRVRYYEVVGIVIQRSGTTQEPDTLTRTSGTFWSWEFSDAISKRFTEHFHGWFSDQVQERKKALRELGVTGQEVSDD